MYKVQLSDELFESFPSRVQGAIDTRQMHLYPVSRGP